METVLVTGAYGFLGTYMVRELTDHGYHVIAFGRNPDKLQTVKGPDVDLYCGDFCNRDDIVEATKGVDYVIHCGALLKGWGRREEYIKTNVEGTRNVLYACEVNNVKRLAYCSSPSTHATRNNLHITEADYNAENRLSYYNESKIMAERLVREQDKVPFAIIRPRGLCGVGDKNMMPVLIRANQTIGIPLFQNGEVIVDMTCIQNVALALRLAMEKDAALGQAYNISNAEPQKLTELAETMFSKLGMEPRYRRLPFGLMYAVAGILEWVYKALGKYDTAPPITRYSLCTLGRSQVFDITKARTELGYEPKISLSEMIDQYARHYLSEKNGKSD